MSTKNQLAFFPMFTVVIIGTMVLGFAAFCAGADSSAKKRKVVLGSVPAVVDTPSHVAYANKYFQEEGLDVQLKLNPDGITSLKQLFKGEVDIAMVTGTPVMYFSFDRDDFVVCGNLLHSKIHYVLARRSSGIEKASDLIGKRVAMMPKTSSAFFLDAYLAFFDLTPKDVKMVPMNAPSMVTAIVNKQVDAIFCWQPFIMQAQNALGKDAILLPSENVLTGSWLIVARRKYVEQHPDTIESFLRAMHKGVQFTNEHKKQASVIYSKTTGVKQGPALSLLKDMTFNLALGQDLLNNLEDQARWAMRYGYVKGKKMPNYLDLIYLKGLTKVAPASITIIR
jgi:NitT/TauT family transport system substrate-binding protein